jgi:transcriptional regulator NrdR family protein
MSEMACPSCGNYTNRVIKSGLCYETNIRHKKSICTHCGAILPTEEKLNLKLFKKLNPTKKIQEPA